MGMGTCNSFPLIRQRFAKIREEMMEDVGIPDNIHKAIVDNHAPNADGIYPDWADKHFVFKHRKMGIL